MNDSKTSLRHEATVWLQYLLIAFVASSVAYGVLESAQRLGSEAELVESSTDAVDINIKQMILAMWYGYYRWWFIVFIALSVIRFLILFLSRRGKSQKVLE